MDNAAITHPGPALLAREARVSYGPVPHQLAGRPMPPGAMGIAGDCFLLRTATGYAMSYRKGEGVTIERAAGADPAEESLWRNGSTYAAIAAINGFLPFHASAVVWRGRVHAFSGPSGAGKSTLATALGNFGLPLLCDDTLVLDVSNPLRIVCLPGHKRVKLTDQALALTGAQREEKVAPMIDKHYAAPPGGTLRQVLPLASLTFLEDGAPLRFVPVAGAARIARLNDDHYTAELYAMARNEALADRFAGIARIAAAVPMERLVRPRDASRFDAITARIAARIKRGADA